MYTKKEYQDHLKFAQMMKMMGTEHIIAIVDGEEQNVDIDLYISNLELIINELDENAVYH